MWLCRRSCSTAARYQPASLAQRYKLTVEYVGTKFRGAQKQPEELRGRTGPTVQDDLEASLAKLVPREPPPGIVLAARTDAGVHAVGNVAHVDLVRRDRHGTPLPAYTEAEVLNALNSDLDAHRIGVVSVRRVARGFHARHAASMRTYVYRLSCGPRPAATPQPTVLRGDCCHAILKRRWLSVFEDHRLVQVTEPLDVPAMRAAAQTLIGEHDWSSFRSARCEASSPVRRLETLDVEEEPPQTLHEYMPEFGRHIALRVRARSFLYNQVRKIVAALIEVGAGRMSMAQLEALLDARDVTQAPILAPAHGLYLASVEYPEASHYETRTAGERWRATQLKEQTAEGRGARQSTRTTDERAACP